MRGFAYNVPIMRKKRHLRTGIRLERVVFYVLVLFVLLDQNTMWSYLIHSPIYGQGFGWATGASCLLIVILSRKYPKDSDSYIVLFALMTVLCFYAFMTQYKTERFFMGYVSVMFFMYLMSISLYKNRNMGSFLSAYSNIMLTIAIISLVFWVFGSLLDIMPGRTAVTYDWAGDQRTSYTYYYLYFENPLQNRGEQFSRNLGLFPEAPGYATFLSYGMLIEAIKRTEINIADTKKLHQNMMKLIIYFITILSTGSSKGIIIVMAIVAMKYLFGKSTKAWKQVIKTVICLIVFVCVVIASIYLIDVKLSTGSGITRLDDLQAGLKTWKQHFLFGAGYMNGDAIRANQMTIRDNEGMSMGLAVMVGYGGLLFLMLYAGAACYAFNGIYFRTRKKEWLLICTVLFINLFISNGAFDTPWIFLIASAYAMPRKKKETKEYWREICNLV